MPPGRSASADPTVAAQLKSARHCTRRFRRPLHNQTANNGGSINEVGPRFQSFRINDLELVAQIFPRWNPLASWMRQIEDFQRAA